MKVWVVEVDTERRRAKLTALPPGTKKQRFSRSGDGGSKRKTSEGGDKSGRRRPGKYSGKSGGDRGGAKQSNNRREKFARRPPAKPKPVIPITEEMMTGDAPMRSFSDLLQFKKKAGDGKGDKKK
jgi:uncharacterized protein